MAPYRSTGPSMNASSAASAAAALGVGNEAAVGSPGGGIPSERTPATVLMRAGAGIGVGVSRWRQARENGVNTW